MTNQSLLKMVSPEAECGFELLKDPNGRYGLHIVPTDNVEETPFIWRTDARSMCDLLERHRQETTYLPDDVQAFFAAAINSLPPADVLAKTGRLPDLKATAMPTAVGTQIEQSKNRIAQMAGLEPAIIQTVKASWDTYMKLGLLLRLRVGRWRGRLGLTMEHLGLIGETHSDLITLGELRLLPTIPAASAFYNVKKPQRTYAQLLDAMDGNARNAIALGSYETPWGRWVPVNTLRDIIEGLDARKAAYMAVRDEIAERWAIITDALLQEYRIEAESAWLRANKLNPGAMRARAEQQLDAYTAQFLANIVRALPSVEEFIASFGFEYELTYIPLPDLLASEQADAATIRAEQQLADQQMRIELNRLSTVQMTNRTQAQAREQMLRDMNQLVVSQAKKQKEALVAEFIDATSGELRRMIVKVVDDVQASIRTHGGDKMMGKSAQQLTNLIDNIERLNFTDDAEIVALLAPIKATLAVETKQRDITSFASTLRDIEIAARTSLLAIEGEGRRGRVIDFESVAPIATIRQARANLNIITNREIEPFDPERQARQL